LPWRRVAPANPTPSSSFARLQIPRPAPSNPSVARVSVNVVRVSIARPALSCGAPLWWQVRLAETIAPSGKVYEATWELDEISLYGEVRPFPLPSPRLSRSPARVPPQPWLPLTLPGEVRYDAKLLEGFVDDEALEVEAEEQAATKSMGERKEAEAALTAAKQVEKAQLQERLTLLQRRNGTLKKKPSDHQRMERGF
jgi:hypothetical protein